MGLQVKYKTCILGLQVSIVGLERALHHYTLEPSDTAFDMKTVPLATQPLTEQKPGMKGVNVKTSIALPFADSYRSRFIFQFPVLTFQ